MLDTHPNVENFRQRAGYVCINGLTGGLTDERLAIEQDELVDRGEPLTHHVHSRRAEAVGTADRDRERAFEVRGDTCLGVGCPTVVASPFWSMS